MKITTNPLTLLRTHARDNVDLYFSRIARSTLHRDVARQNKRMLAYRILAGDQITQLDEEAELRGISSKQLAELIISKPDDVLERENKRQRIFHQIAQAQSQAELDQLLASHDIANSVTENIHA